jgi:hypothetical protein
MQGRHGASNNIKYLGFFIPTGIPNRIPLNFEKGQGLARGKRKGKGNARILASKEKKKFNCKIRGVTTWRPLLLRVCFALSPVTRSQSGWPL